MKKALPSLAVAALLAVGLAGCSGSAAPAAPSTAEPAEAPTMGDDSLQACLDLAGPFAEASGKLASLASGDADPQAAVDGWTALVDALGSVAQSASDQEVKQAATIAQTDFAALRDAMQQVHVNGDLTAMGAFTSANETAQASYTALLQTCQA